MASLRKARTNSNRTMAILTLAMTFLVIAFVSALTTGKYPISLKSLRDGDLMAVRTFTILRLPRALMGLVGGFGLGIAGFVYQTVFRNPLASPDIIGVSSGASAGAAFAILFVSAASPSTTVFAFIGGLLAVCLSLGLTALSPVKEYSSIVLAGIAVHALAQTFLMVLKLMADPEKQLASIEYWIMGSLAGVTAAKIPVPVLIILVTSIAILLLHRHVLALSVREDEARMLDKILCSVSRNTHGSCGGQCYRAYQLYRTSRPAHGETPHRESQAVLLSLKRHHRKFPPAHCGRIGEISGDG